MSRLLNELRRRRVFSTAALYVVGTWLVMQVADVVFPAFEIPDTSLRYILYTAIAGFPFALVVGWFYDIGASGIRRTAKATPDEAAEFEPLRGVDYMVLLSLLGVVGAIVYGTLGGVAGSGGAGEATKATRSGPPVVAVLPFVSSAQAGDSEFFATGVHDDLLTQLSRLESLRVISRTSVMEYRETTLNIREIGEQLGADVILEGGVQLAGEQLRINAQLIDARTDEHLWAETYDRQLSPTEIFQVQRDIALAITSALDATLTVQEDQDLRTLPTDNMAAYRAYRTARDALGRHHLGQGKRQELLEKAVALDPGFAAAWTQLAGLYALRARGGDAQYTILAEDTVEKIRATWPGSIDELTATAFYLYHVIKDYDQALAVLDRAIVRAPSDLLLLELKTWIQRRSGDFEGREATLRRLVELSPREEAYRAQLTKHLVTVHRYAAGMNVVRATEEAGLQVKSVGLALIYRADGDEQALIQRMRALETREVSYYSIYNVVQALLVAREFDAILEIIEERLQKEERFETTLAPAEIEYLMLHWALGREDRILGRLPDIKRFLNAQSPEDGETALAYWYLANALVAGIEGDTEELNAQLQGWERVAANDMADRIGSFDMVCSLYGLSGQAEKAVACLRRAMTTPSLLMPWAALYSVDFDRIRSHPPFVALVEEWEADMAAEGITWPQEKGKRLEGQSS